MRSTAASYDVIVVGARCAGAATAMLLARRGYKVLCVDRARFPSDVPLGHYINRDGPRRLAQWGLLDRIAAVAPAIDSATIDVGDFPLTGKDLVVDGVPLGYGPRRLLLDKILVDAAVDAGVELRERFRVDDFISDGNRMTGIVGRTSLQGTPIREQAAIVIGADGRHSRLARTVSPVEYHAFPTAAVWFFSFWAEVPMSGMELRHRDRFAVVAFPTSGNLVNISVAWPVAEVGRIRGDLERAFLRAIDAVPELAERVHAGRRAERFYGAVDLPNYYRRPYGEGWALVGDAGCHKDPYLALGISDAFRDAELLTDAIDEGLAGGQPLSTSLAQYERRRNMASLLDYRENLSAARFEPVPETVRRIRAAVRGSQEETNRFLMARLGMLPRETFFNRQNLERLLVPTDQSGASAGQPPRARQTFAADLSS